MWMLNDLLVPVWCEVGRIRDAEMRGSDYIGGGVQLSLTDAALTVSASSLLRGSVGSHRLLDRAHSLLVAVGW